MKKNIVFKRVFILTIFLLFLVLGSFSLAQENKTESPLPQASTSDDKVKTLKDKLATQVAELRQNQTRGFYGEIAALSKTSFTLVTEGKEIKVRYNEDTQVFKDLQKTEAATTVLKNGLKISALGLFEEENKQLSAKVVILQALPKNFSGTVNDKDTKNASITLKTKTDELIIDYEKTTTAREYDSVNDTLIKSGLSRIVKGDRLFVWGMPNEEDSKKISAAKILRLSTDILGTSTSASPAASVSPSSKASPITSPKASPKATPAT